MIPLGSGGADQTSVALVDDTLDGGIGRSTGPGTITQQQVQYFQIILITNEFRR